MKLFPTKEKGKPKQQQPKGRPWALSRVLGRSNNNNTKKQQALLPPPVPKTVATRRTSTARTKSTSCRNKNSSLEARLLADRTKSDTAVVNRNRWVPQVPYDEMNHATHNRRTVVPTTSRTSIPTTARRPIPNYPNRPSRMDPNYPNRPSRMDSFSRKSDKHSQEGTSSCTTSLLDDTTLDSFSSGDDGSTLLDTTVASTVQQPDGCQGCVDDSGNRELSLFLCGKILDHAGLRTPQDTREQQEAWDELILDLLLA